jgi:hypothetical protein
MVSPHSNSRGMGIAARASIIIRPQPKQAVRSGLVNMVRGKQGVLQCKAKPCSVGIACQ